MIISLLMGVCLSALTLYLALRNVPLADLAAYLTTINYLWLAPAAALVMATFILRVYRWRIILKSTARVEFWQAYHPLMIGFMMNCVLPGRLGEFARPALLKKKRGIPISTGLATVAAERVFDILMLMLLFAMVFGTIFSRPDADVVFGGRHLNSQTLQAGAWAMIRLSAMMSMVIALLTINATRLWIRSVIMKAAGLTAFAGPTIQRRAEQVTRFAVRLIDHFAAGLDLIRHPRRLGACLGLTILIWGLTAFSYYVLAQGCPGLGLSLTELTTVMVVVCFFIALPSVPGFWGVWEAGGVFALSLFGVLAKDAAGYTLVNHAVHIFPVIIAGLISALIASVNIWQLRYSSA